MIKVKDGYAKLINTSYTGDISLVLLSNGSTIGYDVSTNTILATIGSNVASADKLKNKVKLWGLDFDGTSDVNGSIVMTNDSSIAIKTSSGTDISLLHFPASHNFHLGYGAAAYGFNTYLDGNNIYLRYGTSHTTGLLLNSSGNVTIGSSDLASTNYKLYIGGNVYAADKIISASGFIIPSGKTYSRVHIFANDSASFIQVSNADGSTQFGDLYLSGSNLNNLNSLHLQATTTYISGNVGIGTTSPSAKLHVAGNILATGGFIKSGSDDTYVLLGGGGHKLLSELGTSGGPYLPLTGGTLSGTTAEILGIDRTNGSTAYVSFRNNAIVRGYLGVNPSGNPVFANSSGTAFKIWHEGNDGSGSGLDADLLDGQHGSYYAAASSLGNYLPLSGGTMTGLLILGSNNYTKTIKWANTDYSSASAIAFMGSNGDWVVRSTYASDSSTADLRFNKSTLKINGNIALHTGNSSVSGGGSTWGSSITVKINNTTATLTIPSNPNTDSKVSLSETTTSNYRPVILGYTSSSTAGSGMTTSTTNVVYASNKFYAKPSTGDLYATLFNGNLNGKASSADWLNPNTTLTYGASGLNYFNINGTAGNTKANNTPTSAWYHVLRMNHANSGGYLADIAVPLNDVGGIWWRQIRNGSFYGWYKVVDSNNYAGILDGRYRNAKISRAGGSYFWYNIQQYDSSDANPSYYSADCAIINITSYAGWLPWIRAVDSEKGSWAIGLYTTNFLIGYIPKTNTSNSLTKNWTFYKDGALWCPGTVTATHFYENSDILLKTNILEILRSDNIPTIKEFDWKDSGEHSYGLIAQELEEQGYSELVSIKDDGYKTVNYSAALSLIVGKLQVKIRELEKEIEILKNKN